MAKLFTVRAKAFTSEELYGLLKHMPVRVLMNLAKHHNIETTRETVAFDLSHQKKLFTTITFSLGFQL